MDICRKNESCKQATSPHPTKKYLSAPTKGLGTRPGSCRLQGTSGFTTVTSIQILSLRHNRTTTKSMMEAQAKSRLAGIQRRVRAALIRIRRSTTKKERFPLTHRGTIQAGLMEKGDPGSARSSRREQGGEGEMGTQINRNRIGGKKEASFSLPPASRFSPRSLRSWQRSGSCDVFPLMQWDWIPSGRVLLLGLPSGKKGER